MVAVSQYIFTVRKVKPLKKSGFMSSRDVAGLKSRFWAINVCALVL